MAASMPKLASEIWPAFLIQCCKCPSTWTSDRKKAHVGGGLCPLAYSSSFEAHTEHWTLLSRSIILIARTTIIGKSIIVTDRQGYLFNLTECRLVVDVTCTWTHNIYTRRSLSGWQHSSLATFSFWESLFTKQAW